MDLWAPAYYGVNMGELGSRPVCIGARLRDRVKEQKEWTWAYTCVTITGDSTYERQRDGRNDIWKNNCLLGKGGP